MLNVPPRLVLEGYRIPDFCTVYVIPPSPPAGSTEDALHAVLSQVLAISHTLSKQPHTQVDTVIRTIEDFGSSFDIGLRMHTDGLWYERKVALHLYSIWSHQYPQLLFIEDPFDESDPHQDTIPFHQNQHSPFILFSRYLASDVLRIGEWAASHPPRSGLCLKLNESGLISNLVDAVRVSREHSVPFLMLGLETDGFEGNPQTIVDIALGTGVDFLKIGRIHSHSGSSAINHILRLYY